MTQFMLVERPVSTAFCPGIRLHPLAARDDLSRAVATHYFGGVDECRLVTDAKGRAEPLIDAVWAAQSAGHLEATLFVRWLRTLVAADVGFVCWCAIDHRDLPDAGAFCQARHRRGHKDGGRRVIHRQHIHHEIVARA